MEKNIIKIAEVNQEFEAVSAVAALNDAGIAASYKPTVDNNPLALPGAMGLPESYDIFISEDCSEEAKNILVGVGAIASDEAEGNSDKEDSEECNTEKRVKAAEETAAEPQSLNDLMPDNPVLAAIYKVVFALLALAAIGVFVWLCDTVIAKVMELFK